MKVSSLLRQWWRKFLKNHSNPKAMAKSKLLNYSVGEKWPGEKGRLTSSCFSSTWAAAGEFNCINRLLQALNFMSTQVNLNFTGRSECCGGLKWTERNFVSQCNKHTGPTGERERKRANGEGKEGFGCIRACIQSDHLVLRVAKSWLWLWVKENTCSKSKDHRERVREYCVCPLCQVQFFCL